MIGDPKEVDFAKYCKRCRYFDTQEYEEPCNECLENPAMQDSHKPMNFEEKDGKAWNS